MQSYPWWAVQRERADKEKSETKLIELRTELVKIGEEVLRELEKQGGSADIIKKFKRLVEKARSSGVYRT